MRQEYVFDLQAMFGCERQIPVDVALRIDDRRDMRFFIPDNVGGVGQAIQVELLQDHDSPSSHTASLNTSSYTSSSESIYFGWGTIRKYGRGAFQPFGYFCFASSSVTTGRMITSSPGFQFTGVATLCFAVSCIESTTRSTSSKLRPVLIG